MVSLSWYHYHERFPTSTRELSIFELNAWKYDYYVELLPILIFEEKNKPALQNGRVLETSQIIRWQRRLHGLYVADVALGGIFADGFAIAAAFAGNILVVAL